jgi:hypothetical protein
MVRKKKSNRAKSKVIEESLPKPFSLKDHLDIKDEANRFEVPIPRAMEIMREVEEESPPVLSLTLKEHETELRDRFYRIYNEELWKLRTCSWCGKDLTEIGQAIAHIRVHLLLQDKDPRVSRAAASDIEDQLFPQIEKQISAVLTGEDRKKLVERLRHRQDLD